MGSKQRFLHKITIISGKRDVGKTQLCCLLRDICLQAGKTVKGVISPGLYQDNRKTGILTQDIVTQESRQIARYAPGWDKDNPNREWEFNQNAIQWANERLASTVPTDCLIIDEIGYLELEENSGWTAAVKNIDEGFFNYAIVVIRPDLIKQAQQRWGATRIFIVNEGDNLKAIAGDVMHYLLEEE